MTSPCIVEIFSEAFKSIDVIADHPTPGNIVHARKPHSRLTDKLVLDSRSALEALSDIIIFASRAAANIGLKSIDYIGVRSAPIFKHYQVIKGPLIAPNSVARAIDTGL
jgi:hypothetical protein